MCQLLFFIRGSLTNSTVAVPQDAWIFRIEA